MADRLLELVRRLGTERERPLDRATAELTQARDQGWDRNDARVTYKAAERTGDRLYDALGIAATGAGLQAHDSPKERPQMQKPDRIPTELETAHMPRAAPRPQPEHVTPGMGGMFGARPVRAAAPAQQAEPIAAPAPATDPHAGRTLAEAMQGRQAGEKAGPQIDRLAAILQQQDQADRRATQPTQKPPTPAPTGPRRDFDRDR